MFPSLTDLFSFSYYIFNNRKKNGEIIIHKRNNYNDFMWPLSFLMKTKNSINLKLFSFLPFPCKFLSSQTEQGKTEVKTQGKNLQGYNFAIRPALNSKPWTWTNDSDIIFPVLQRTVRIAYHSLFQLQQRQTYHQTKPNTFHYFLCREKKKKKLRTFIVEGVTQNQVVVH